MLAFSTLLLAFFLFGCTTNKARPAGALTSEQAKSLAKQLANDKADSLFGWRPFWNGAPARLEQGYWLWKDRRACGYGDMEATVILSKDGGVKSVDVILLDSRTERLFYRLR
jgi:hypothetical protein